MDDFFLVLMTFLVGVALGITIAVSPDGVVVVKGKADQVQTVEYKKRLYKLVLVEVK